MTASRIMDASEIEFKNFRFLIINGPTDKTIDKFIEECRKYKVCDVVRVCEQHYDSAPVTAAGMPVHDWSYQDGSAPPDALVKDWLSLAQSRGKDMPAVCLAVHCVAGLGRAPVLVAVALMELGLCYEDAVELIRSKRRGALNQRQLEFLQRYRPKKRLRSGASAASSDDKCHVM